MLFPSSPTGRWHTLEGWITIDEHRLIQVETWTFAVRFRSCSRRKCLNFSELQSLYSLKTRYSFTRLVWRTGWTNMQRSYNWLPEPNLHQMDAAVLTGEWVGGNFLCVFTSGSANSWFQETGLVSLPVICCVNPLYQNTLSLRSHHNCSPILRLLMEFCDQVIAHCHQWLCCQPVTFPQALKDPFHGSNCFLKLVLTRIFFAAPTISFQHSCRYSSLGVKVLRLETVCLGWWKEVLTVWGPRLAGLDFVPSLPLSLLDH